MGLIGNGSVYNKDNGKVMCGSGQASSPAQNAGAGTWHKNGLYRNRHWFIQKQSSVPEGYGFQSFRLPQKDGGMASINQVTGSGLTGTVNLAGGRNGAGSLTGTGDLSGTSGASGIVSSSLSGVGGLSGSVTGLVGLISSLSGSGSITSADVLSIIAAQASLSGSASLSADVAGVLQALADLTGTSSFTGSASSALYAAAALAGSGDVSAATAKAAGVLSAAITVAGAELTPSSLADAVAGIEIETGYTLKDILRLTSAALAGKLSGAPGTTITIRDINDAFDRIIATVDSSGNRTSVTKDVSG